MQLLLFLLFGLIVGALARLIVPGREPGGWGVSLIIGVIGSFLGGFLGRALGFYSESQRTGGWVSSIIGAIVVAFIYRAILARRATRTDLP
ncbi:putative membrane protein [Minicystis rosea]|nr:putative membrane protein [Minicystis rosea]